jgi:hypothetical protein
MKKSIFYLTTLVLMAAAVLSSCDLVEDLLDINFETGWKHIPFTVDPENAGEITYHKTYIQSDLVEEIEDNGGNIDNLENVEVSEGRVAVLSSGRSFDPFAWIEVYLRAPGDTDSSLVASATDVNNGATLIEMVVDPISLNDILAQDEYVVTILGELDQDLTESLNLEVQLKYDVTVSP